MARRTDRISRFKKRESDRSGFDYKEIQLIRDKGSLVGADEFDMPPPSDQPLGGEGDVSPGFTRADYTSTNTPSHLDKVNRIINATDGIPFVPKLTDSEEPWIYVSGTSQSVNISANPQIASGIHNYVYTIECVSNNVVLENGSGLSLRAHFNMDSGSIITLIYNATNTLWYETSRSHRTKNLGEF